MAEILIRADADAAMGIGHVMRCLALAEALAEAGHACRFACARLPQALHRRLAAGGFAVDTRPVEAGAAADLAWTRSLAGTAGAAAVLLDGYHFDAGYRAGLRSGAWRVAAFHDGGGPSPLHADLVINPSPAAAGEPYARTAPGARLLLGPRYMPLRRELRHALAAPRPPLAARTAVFLNFGGTDPAGLTAPCLAALAPRLPAGVRLDVAVGGGNPRTDAVEAAAEPFGARVAVHRDSPALGRLMAQAGLAVSAGGGTAGELAAFAVPTLLVVAADNQAHAAAAAAAEGVVRVVDGRAGAAAANCITAAALALWNDAAARAALAARLAGRIDGQGAVRIAAAIAAAIGDAAAGIDPASPAAESC